MDEVKGISKLRQQMSVEKEKEPSNTQGGLTDLKVIK
jgi:hypothetical protein